MEKFKGNPLTAIWFQNNGDLFASVTVVNNLYHYRITDKYGLGLIRGDEKTLSGAKKKVFSIFEGNE